MAAIRINTYLRDRGVASRREADRLIAEGAVSVNGKKAQAGMLISPNDTVIVQGAPKTYRAFAYYKPRGLATQALHGTSDVINEWKPKGLFPIGRLDKESEGLLILTDDGSLTRLLGQSTEKEYLVDVREPLAPRVVGIFAKGMQTEAFGTLLPAKAEIVNAHTLRVVLREGKRHQIRVMLGELHYTVTALKRVRIGTVSLGSLRPGQTRPLSQEEVMRLKESK